MPSPASHLRAPLLWLLLPLMTGLVAAKLWPAPGCGLGPLVGFAGGLSLVAGGLAQGASLRAQVGWGLCLVAAGAVAGFVMLHARYPHLHESTVRPPREATVTVEILREFPLAPASRSLTGLGRIVATGEADRELTGQRVYYSAIRKVSLPPRRSGRYTMRGVIEPLAAGDPASGFNDYLENLGIRLRLTRAQVVAEVCPPGRFQRFCRGAEARLEGILRRGLEGHPAITSLYFGMLLGDKAVLTPEQEDSFVRSGTFHIFSVSGLHVGVIAVALHSLLGLLRVRARPTAGLTLVLLWLYVQITGGNTPAERAFLMVAFVLSSRVFHLPGNGLAALTAAALTTLVIDPLQLFSTGFQMSYSVVVGLVVMAVPLGHKWLAAWHPFAFLPPADWRWYHHGISQTGRWLIGSSAACLVAFLASTPSSIGNFQVLSPGSLVANLIIIPVSSLALIAGFLSLLTGLAGLWPWSVLFNSAAAVTLTAMDWLLRHGTALPGVYFPAHFSRTWLAPTALGLMMAALLAGVAGRWSRRYGGFWPPVAILALILILGVNFG